jgi:hypothetical protein
MAKPKAIIADLFRATGAELKDAAAQGDTAAQGEIDRRAANRAAKAAARKAA